MYPGLREENENIKVETDLKVLMVTDLKMAQQWGRGYQTWEPFFQQQSRFSQVMSYGEYLPIFYGCVAFELPLCMGSCPLCVSWWKKVPCLQLQSSKRPHFPTFALSN